MASKFAKVKRDNYTRWKELAQYILVYIIIGPYFNFFYKIKIEGEKNIPEGKSFIVAANHMSYMDPMLVSYAVARPIAFMAKEELFHVPVLAQYIQQLGAFAVNREKFEIATIRSAKEVLATKKWIMAMFPQGTRIAPGKIGKINQGFAYIAKMTNAEILPVSITGADKYNFIPFKGQITVKIGKPMPVPTDVEETMDEWGRIISDMTGFEYDKKESIGVKEKQEAST